MAKRLYVHTAFKLNAGGSVSAYPVGIAEFSDEDVEHWLVKLNTSDEAPAEAQHIEADLESIRKERDDLAAERAQLEAEKAAFAAEKAAMQAKKASKE